MSVPATADDLVLLIRKSGLVDERKLTTFLNAHQKDGVLSSEPKKVVAAMVREGLLTYFQGEQYLLGKWRGFTLGKFKLLERIGVGGMGQVFLCEHTFMRKRMAVKVLPPAKAEDPVSLGRFYREARVASGLEHPNIVRTYDIDQDGPLHFLVMEYMDGASLLEIVKRLGPMNVLRACHYIKQACSGLQYAHSRGMIHRDIKPGNILVDRTGVAKLLDMGLARFYQDEQDQLTIKYDDKNVLGTADYVAPEQTRDSRNIDIRADIYGMGATFYYVLAGRPPFPETTMAEKLIAHQSKTPTPLRDIRSDIPAGVARIIDKMMAKDPKDRYQTPQDVVDALEVWTQEPIDPPTADEMPRLSPAAVESGYAAKSAAPPAPEPAVPSRDPEPPRANEQVASRRAPSQPARPTVPEPDDRDIEEGVTVPVPPSMRPAFAARKPAGSESEIDLVGMMGQPSTIRPSAAPAETRSISFAQPTPPAGSLRAVTASPSKHEPPKMPPGPMGPKLPGSAPGSAPLPPLRPSAHGTVPLRPSVHGTAPPRPSAHGTAPPRPSAHGVPSRPSAVPTETPGGESKSKSGHGVELPKLRSFHGTTPIPAPTPPIEGGPLRPSSPGRPTRPSSLESFKIQPPKPPEISRTPFRQSAIEPPKLPAPTGLSHTPLRRAAGSANMPLGRSAQPLYKPPTMVPYFDQPIATPNPTFFAVLVRWILMVGISSLVGAGLGAVIWFKFFRHPI